MAMIKRGRSSAQTEAPDFGETPIRGTARLGRKTKVLVKRLERGDIAIVDHADLDRISAEDLVESGVRAVVNVAPSSTDTYPNAGPLILTRSGVALVDMVGAPLFERIKDGAEVVLIGAVLYRAGIPVAQGSRLDPETVALAYESQRNRVGEAIERFADNTVAHLRQESQLLTGSIELPPIATRLRDRHALVVVRGTDHRKDLKAIKPYVREQRPAIIGVDGAGDAVLEAGLKPDIIIGDMDSATDRALTCGAELIVHAYPDGTAPGRQRLERMGLAYKLFPAPGTSQDIAMLMAYEKGASLIVSVGSHMNLVEFLDKNRAGMSSTFITRLRVGEILVDTKGVSRLYRPAPNVAHMVLLVVAAAVTAVIVVLTSPELAHLSELFWLKVRVLLGV